MKVPVENKPSASLYSDVMNYIDTIIADWTAEWSLLTIIAILIVLLSLKHNPFLLIINILKRATNSLFLSGYSFLKKLSFKPKELSLKSLFESIVFLTGNDKKRYNIPTYLAMGRKENLAILLKNIGAGERENLILQNHQKSGNKYGVLFEQGCVVSHPKPAEISPELSEYRPERPIDGIILCLSVSQFSNLTMNDIDDDASEIYQQLWKLQKEFNFILPIYLLIVDCHEINGFEEYWSFPELTSHLDDIVGWSNPYDKNQTFNTKWIDEAFLTTSNTLRNIHSNFIIDGKDNSSLNALLFPNNINKIAPKIARYCETLFNHSSYQSSVMFRGIYFSGKLKDEKQNQYVDKFLATLFSHKIFQENNLAYASQQQLFSSNRKLRIFQYFFTALFFSAFAWLTFDALNLTNQAKNLTNKIKSLPTSTSEQDKTSLSYVRKVLLHVSDMDASNLQYWSIPWSFSPTLNNQLKSYFAKDIFGEIVFPAFEKQIHDKVSKQINLFTMADNHIEWLTTLDNNLALRNELVEIMARQDLSRPEIAKRFRHIANNIDNTALSEGFFQNSTLYFDAISNVKYQPNQLYTIGQNEKEQLWVSVLKSTQAQQRKTVSNISAPKSFFNKLIELQSIPATVTWYQKVPDFSADISKYLHWTKEMKTHWLSGSVQENDCQQVSTILMRLENVLTANSSDFGTHFLSRCQQAVEEQMIEDTTILFPTLYTKEGTAFHFSLAAEKIFTQINKLSSLSFINVRAADYFTEGDNDFYWSVDKLDQVLTMIEEYEQFANKNFDSIPLSDEHTEDIPKRLAHAVALKQLQLSILTGLSNARVKNLTKNQLSNMRITNTAENYLQNHVRNFQLASDKLHSIYQKLDDLQFIEGKRTFTKITTEYVYSLLEKVNLAYQSSQLYTPLYSPRWEEHQYIQALFGINGEGQLQDYLAAQEDRINYLASNYAEPLLVYLKTVKPSDNKYQLISHWENSLVELNKRKDKNPANSVSQLTSFFTNDLLSTDQSNCFKATKKYVTPQENNLFAFSQKDIATKATEHCNRFRADLIEQEYADLQLLFTQSLANKYPFSQAVHPAMVSPATLKKFIETYPGKSDGLAERLQVLIKVNHEKYKKYDPALTFVRQLDASIDFFKYVLASQDGKNPQGISITSDLNINESSSRHVNHILNWQFQTGQQKNVYPGSSENITWLSNNATTLSLQWADNSPYIPDAINGVTNNQTLQYQQKGMWSLLQFIQTYQSTQKDTQAMSAASILLEFTANLSSKSSTANDAEPQKLLAFLRLTLYGIDPDTKESIAIELPKQFPKFAPQISRKTKGK